MKVRSYETDDLKEICSVYNRSREKEACFTDVEASMKEMMRLTQGEDIYVVTEDGTSTDRVVGFIAIWSPEKFVHHLYVDPQHQGEHIATDLIQHCVNVYGYPLSLKCLAANMSACGFYDTSGWINIGRSLGSEGDAILYRLDEAQEQS